MRDKAATDNLPISEFTMVEQNVCLDKNEFVTTKLFGLMKAKLMYEGCEFEIDKIHTDTD